MHLHRVIGGAQIFLVLLAAIALAEAWQELAGRRQVAAAIGATALLLYPMARERAQYLENNAAWGRRNLENYAAERPAIDAVVARAKQRGGRAYAGLAATWGGRFKVGDVPFYAFLSTAQVPTVGFLYHAMALTGDILVRFNDRDLTQYRLFNIQSVIAPAGSPPPSQGLIAEAPAGPFQIFDAPGGGYFDVVDVAAAVTTNRRNFYDVNDRWLASGWPARRRHLLLDWRGSAPPGGPRIAPDAPLPFVASGAPDPRLRLEGAAERRELSRRVRRAPPVVRAVQDDVASELAGLRGWTTATVGDALAGIFGSRGGARPSYRRVPVSARAVETGAGNRWSAAGSAHRTLTAPWRCVRSGGPETHFRAAARVRGRGNSGALTPGDGPSVLVGRSGGA